MKTTLQLLIPGLLIMLFTACPSGNEKIEQPEQKQVELLDEFLNSTANN